MKCETNHTENVNHLCDRQFGASMKPFLPSEKPLGTFQVKILHNR